MDHVRILSGLGEKGPACIQLNIGDECWLLDCGQGPEAYAPFKPSWLDGATAVFITHDHIDHIGGAAHAVEKGLPIYTTRHTAMALPPAADVRELPESGTTLIHGVPVTTGRSGHALGGVWLHFDVGEGLFYSGDWSEESGWFQFEPPPEAATTIIDCSYYLDDVAQSQRHEDLEALVEVLDGQILFPVPPSGRAGELALFLSRRFGMEHVALDSTCRAALSSALHSRSVASGAEVIAPLILRNDMDEARFLICDTPNADGGAAWDYVRAWRENGRLGVDAHVIFTGHMTAHARGIESASGGYFQRWNVHPPLRDQIAMVQRLGAKRYAPAFCGRPEDYLMNEEFGAEVFFHDCVEL